MKSVLIFHNILWAHYKGAVFTALFELCAQRSIAMEVVHFSPSDSARADLSEADRELQRYPYSVLSNQHYSDISLWTKARLSLRALYRSKPDVVVLPGYWDASFWVLLAVSRLLGKVVILTFDSTEFDRPHHWIKE